MSKLSIEERLARIEAYILNNQVKTNPVSQLRQGYLPIKDAWRTHCYFVTYETFKEFVREFNIQTFPHQITRKGHIVNTKQIKVVNVQRLAADILISSVNCSMHYYTHPKLTSKFLIKR